MDLGSHLLCVGIVDLAIFVGFTLFLGVRVWSAALPRAVFTLLMFLMKRGGDESLPCSDRRVKRDMHLLRLTVSVVGHGSPRCMPEEFCSPHSWME